jgi:hypothetical protein
VSPCPAASAERAAADLMAGYQNVWALLAGARSVVSCRWKGRHCGGSWQDKTSVLIDGRPEIGLTPRLRKAISTPLHDASKAKDDGRLPMTDQNPRIFVVGTHGAEARNRRGDRP